MVMGFGFPFARVWEPEQTASRTMTALQGLWTARKTRCPALLSGRPSGLPPRNAAASPPPTPHPGTPAGHLHAQSTVQ